MDDVLTVEELATLLKMSKRQVYEMTNSRTRSGAMRDNPIPFVKINSNVRFLRSQIEVWLQTLATKKG